MTEITSVAEKLIDNNRSKQTKLWMSDEGDTLFNYDGNEYRIVSLNNLNQEKLNAITENDYPIDYVSLDRDGKCVISARIDATTTIPVFCHVELYTSREIIESSITSLLTALTETTTSKNGGADYHEIHPDGDLTRGMKDGIAYQEVLNDKGETTYLILVDGSKVGMYFSEQCYAVVLVGKGRNDDEILEVGEKDKFLSLSYESEDLNEPEYSGMSEDELICDAAYRELACPRWGLSW